MAKITPNEFTSYELTEEESLTGSALTITQAQVMQNRLAIAAAELLALKYDVNNPNSYIQEEAYKRGELEAYRGILAFSESAIDLLTSRERGE